MRRLWVIPVYAILTALVALSTGCSLVDARISEDFRTSYPKAPATLTVQNPVGAMDVEAWDQPGIEIVAHKRGPTLDAVNAIKIEVESKGSTLSVNSIFPMTANNVKVDYTIHTPASTALNLVQSVGAIKSAGFTGDVQEHTSTGAIEASMAALGGTQRVHMDVSVGAIKLTLPANTSASVTANTSVGAIKTDFPLAVNRTVVGQNASGKIGDGAAVLDLSIATGAIDIQRE